MPPQVKLNARLPDRRLALAAIGLILASLYALAAYNYVTELQNAEVQLRQSAQAAGQAIFADLRHKMMTNDRGRIRALAVDALRTAGIERVLIIGPKGHVYVDSRPQPGDRTLAVSLPGCIECHFAASAAARPEAAPLKFRPDTIRVATAIPHEVSCSSCHLPTGAGLGVVLVDVSLTEGVARARAMLAIWIGLSTLGGLGAAWWIAGRPLPTWRPATPAWPSLHWLGRLRPGVVGWAALLTGAVVVGSGGWFAVHLENDNAFCAACHTEPETAFYQRTLAPPTDLASRHAAEDLACITCHSGAGALGRGGALLLGARNLAAYLVGGYGQPARALTPLPDEQCVKCHSASENDPRLERHYHYYLAAWQRARPDEATTCAACHLSHNTEGRAEEGFLNDLATKQVCARCHVSAAP